MRVRVDNVIKNDWNFQHLHWSSHHVDSIDSGGALGWPRTSRPRVNSAIDVAGFLSQVSHNRAGKNPRSKRSMNYVRTWGTGQSRPRTPADRSVGAISPRPSPGMDKVRRVTIPARAATFQLQHLRRLKSKISEIKERVLKILIGFNYTSLDKQTVLHHWNLYALRDWKIKLLIKLAYFRIYILIHRQMNDILYIWDY